MYRRYIGCPGTLLFHNKKSVEIFHTLFFNYFYLSTSGDSLVNSKSEFLNGATPSLGKEVSYFLTLLLTNDFVVCENRGITTASSTTKYLLKSL